MEQVQDCDRDALAQQHVRLGGVRLCRALLPAPDVAVLLGQHLRPLLDCLHGLPPLQFARGEVPALHSVGMDEVEQPMDIDPGTTLLGVHIVLILRGHLLFGKNAVNIVKVGAVIFQQPPKSLGLDLMSKLIECIAIDEELLL